MRTMSRSRTTASDWYAGKRGEVFHDRLGAGEGNRTLVVSLGSFCSAIELRPRGFNYGRGPGRVQGDRHGSTVGQAGHGIGPTNRRREAASEPRRHAPYAGVRCRGGPTLG